MTLRPLFCDGFFWSRSRSKLMNQIGTEIRYQESKNHAALGVPPASLSHSRVENENGLLWEPPSLAHEMLGPRGTA